MTEFLVWGKDGEGHDFQRDLRNQLVYFLNLTWERTEAMKREVTLMVPSAWWQNWIRMKISWDFSPGHLSFVRGWLIEEVILK